MHIGRVQSHPPARQYWHRSGTPPYPRNSIRSSARTHTYTHTCIFIYACNGGLIGPYNNYNHTEQQCLCPRSRSSDRYRSRRGRRHTLSRMHNSSGRRSANTVNHELPVSKTTCVRGYERMDERSEGAKDGSAGRSIPLCLALRTKYYNTLFRILGAASRNFPGRLIPDASLRKAVAARINLHGFIISYNKSVRSRERTTTINNKCLHGDRDRGQLHEYISRREREREGE